jgi:hypothetical protein
MVLRGDLDAVRFENQVADGEDQAVGADHHAGAAAAPAEGLGERAPSAATTCTPTTASTARARASIGFLLPAAGGAGMRHAAQSDSAQAGQAAAVRKRKRPWPFPEVRPVRMRQKDGRAATGACHPVARPPAPVRQSFCIIRCDRIRMNSNATISRTQGTGGKTAGGSRTQREQEISDASAEIKRKIEVYGLTAAISDWRKTSAARQFARQAGEIGEIGSEIPGPQGEPGPADAGASRNGWCRP